MSYDRTSPTAAETYFDHSIFGQLYTLIAEALQRSAPRRGSPRPAATGLHAQPTRRPDRSLDRRPLLDRLDAWFWRQQQAAQEAYLAGSQDVFELERRIEALDRGGRYY